MCRIEGEDGSCCALYHFIPQPAPASIHSGCLSVSIANSSPSTIQFNCNWQSWSSGQGRVRVEAGLAQWASNRAGPLALGFAFVLDEGRVKLYLLTRTNGQCRSRRRNEQNVAINRKLNWYFARRYITRLCNRLSRSWSTCSCNYTGTGGWRQLNCTVFVLAIVGRSSIIDPHLQCSRSIRSWCAGQGIMSAVCSMHQAFRAQRLK